MAFFRNYWLILLLACGVVALVTGGMILRAQLIDAARADLQTRGLYRFQILSTRVPCGGTFAIGVSVMYQNSANEMPTEGRLCRSPEWTTEWKLYPADGAR